MNRPTSQRLAIVAAISLVVLGACGKSKTAETTLAAESAPASTVATSAVDSAAPGTSVADSAAVANSNVTAVATDANSTNPVSTEAGSDRPAVGPNVNASKIAAQIAAFGIVDKAKVECVTKAAGTKPVPDGTMPVGLIKGIMTCAPEAMADTSLPALKTALPTLTDEQAKCVAFATFKVLASLSDNDFKAAFSTGSTNAMPDDVKKKATNASKSCGLSAADLEKAMNG